jgi:predicted RNase H-like HicB family nuclease
MNQTATYTAIVQQHGEWWIGWVEEVPGVNSQGQTRAELLENLRDALDEAIEMNRADARAAASGAFEEVSIPVVHFFSSLMAKVSRGQTS